MSQTITVNYHDGYQDWRVVQSKQLEVDDLDHTTIAAAIDQVFYDGDIADDLGTFGLEVFGSVTTTETTISAMGEEAGFTINLTPVSTERVPAPIAV